MTDKNEKITLVFPAYNEEKAIGIVLDKANKVLEKSGWEYEIIVVDDGSTDNTAKIAEEKHVCVLRHQTNRGVGRARKTGIKAATGSIIIMSDADDTYPLEEIPELLELSSQYDMVIGARKIESGTMRPLRSFAKWFIRTLASFVSAQKIIDLNSGMRLFRKKTAMKFFNILPNGHSWVSTITLAYLCNGYTVGYHPIDYFERKGISTFHPIKDTATYLVLVIRTIMFFNPLKFFFPLSVVLYVFGLTKLIYDWRILRDIRESDIMIVIVGVLVAALGFLADLIVKQHQHQYLDME
ncbi:MAG: hypothetical protein A2161_22160 [Candidatus Schekmanbacteria bacterium RBG_13_48_7]|uniref:Glycosyltransferase 2-like domain-containing protein n=1 Tax=Candidatus Schekmanbacteria bacterium RBG_13_48_7 TaxID=1817878 RepID=A0A1F7RYB1_9BACT|nr:MAG: hypothetical protein A2161_22160 [Candidatus Schekmanbacteria bacterium RBG_13_48_7]